MLNIFDRAPSPFTDYIVASLGYDNKSDAYANLKYYPGTQTQVYFDRASEQWFILEKA